MLGPIFSKSPSIVSPLERESTRRIGVSALISLKASMTTELDGSENGDAPISLSAATRKREALEVVAPVNTNDVCVEPVSATTVTQVEPLSTDSWIR